MTEQVGWQDTGSYQHFTGMPSGEISRGSRKKVGLRLSPAPDPAESYTCLNINKGALQLFGYFIGASYIWAQYHRAAKHTNLLASNFCLDKNRYQQKFHVIFRISKQLNNKQYATIFIYFLNPVLNQGRNFMLSKLCLAAL